MRKYTTEEIMEAFNELVFNTMGKDEKEMVEKLNIMADEYQLYKEITERLEKDPCYLYDLDTILDYTDLKVMRRGTKHDEQNKDMILPDLHMVILTTEYWDKDDEEWLIKKVKVIRL